MDKYIFKPHHTLFFILFEKEKLRIQSYLTTSHKIEHIGSAAILGLGGKGIIDIYIQVDKYDLQRTSEQIMKAGYEYRETASTDNHKFFKITLPDPLEKLRTYHVHITVSGSHDWLTTLAFRDYLRAHPIEATAYAAIKKEASLKANNDKDAYMKMKEPFIRRIIKKALEEKRV